MTMQDCAIGVDLGGTKIEVAIVSAQGQLFDRLRIPTQSSQEPDEIIKKTTDAIEQLSAQNPDIISSVIGLGVAGQIEKKTGNVIYAPNLGWHNINLQEQLANKLHKPVSICNDVVAAAYGEWLYGAGIDCDNLVCIFIGTGIGGAIIANGKMLEGCNNTAGEIGHITLQLQGPICHCGNKGCFEALASGWAIQRDAQLAVKNNRNNGKMLLEMANGDILAITAKTVAMAAQNGDALAANLLDNVTNVVIAGITSAVNMLGPCRIILGGGIVEGIPQLIGHVETGVKKNALKAAMNSVSILQAKLHNDSGVIGAAAFAQHQLNNNKHDH
jgi:glucokinase